MISRIDLYIILFVTLLINAVAVSIKWIWYEIFAGDNYLNSLSRIKYKINCDDTFFRPSSKHTSRLFAFYSLSTQAGTTYSKTWRAAARCLGLMTAIAVLTIRHTKISDYDVLCVVHLPDSSLFSDISDDRINIVAPAIVKRCVEAEKVDKNPTAGKF